MPASEIDHETARLNMIEGQIRPERVRHPAIIAAMASLPRELFVPASLRGLAYLDRELDLGGGHALTEPRVLARLLQAAEPRRGERALVVEAGSGYAAALLARMGLDVTAVEPHDEIRASGEAACRASGEAVTWCAVLPAAVPFPLVLIDGAVEVVPEEIVHAVAPDTGRLLTVSNGANRPGRAVIGERTGDALRLRTLFDASARLLPAYAAPRGFEF